MRRVDREVVSFTEKLEIINKCKVCRIAMIDANKPYIVPLNFGYSVDDNTVTLFFHSAKEGRKVDVLRSNPVVCFEMDCENQLITADIPCKYGYAFESIIGNGNITFIEDVHEKMVALNMIMKHQTGKEFTFDEKSVGSVLVYKLVVTDLSGKKKEKRV